MAAHFISKLYQKVPAQTFLIGLTRTLIGLAFGCAYWYFVRQFGTGGSDSAFLLGLIPIRIVEWLLLLKIFYDRQLTQRKRAAGVSIAGAAWSYLLDVPAIFGFVLVSGFWIC